MNESTLVAALVDLIDSADQDSELYGARARTFDEMGILTMNEGIVIRTEDGSEFQVTVIRSK